MKKILLLSLFLMACSSQENSSKTNQPQNDQISSEFEVDISRLNNDSFDLSLVGEILISPLNFGSISGGDISKSLMLKNLSQSAISIAPQVSGEGYSLKINRCPNSLAPGGSCRLDVSFKSRDLYNGSHLGLLSLTRNAEDLPLSLSAQITGKIDPNTQNVDLSLALSSPFYTQGQVPGSLLTRILTISNLGPGNSDPIEFTMPQDYAVRVLRCGSLKAKETCTIQLAYKPSRQKVPQQNEQSMMTVFSANSNEVMEINLVSGQVGAGTPPPVALPPVPFIVSGCIIESGPAGVDHVCFGNSNLSVTFQIPQSTIDQLGSAALFNNKCGESGSSQRLVNPLSNSVNTSFGAQTSHFYSLRIFSDAGRTDLIQCVDVGQIGKDSTAPEINFFSLDEPIAGKTIATSDPAVIPAGQGVFSDLDFGAYVDLNSSTYPNGYQSQIKSVKLEIHLPSDVSNIETWDPLDRPIPQASGTAIADGEYDEELGGTFYYGSLSIPLGLANGTYSYVFVVEDMIGNIDYQSATGEFLYLGGEIQVQSIDVNSAGNGRLSYDGGYVTVTGLGMYSLYRDTEGILDFSTKMYLVCPAGGIPPVCLSREEFECPEQIMSYNAFGMVSSISCNTNGGQHWMNYPGDPVYIDLKIKNPQTGQEITIPESVEIGS